MFHLLHVVGDSQLGRGGGGGLPGGFLQFPFPSESDVIKLAFFFFFRVIIFVVSAIFILVDDIAFQNFNVSSAR